MANLRMCVELGDIITPVDIEPLHILIVWPATMNYQRLRCSNTITNQDYPSHNSTMTGNHHKTILLVLPFNYAQDIGDLLSTLMDCDGCIIARMSGSGSACFGIFETAEQSEKASQNFKNSISTCN